MNRPTSSKFVPGLPDDDNITAPTNVNPISDDDSIKIYDGVAESTVNDDDTVKNVKIRAKNLAQHKVQEKIADYVDAFLRDRLLKFPKEEIWSVASKIFTITDVKYNFIDSDDDKTIIRATVLAKVDDKDIMNYIIKTFKEIETLRKENADLKRQNETLRRENANLGTLRKENDDLKRQNDNLSRENANLKRQNAYLNQKIDELTPKTITADKIALARQKTDISGGRKWCKNAGFIGKNRGCEKQYQHPSDSRRRHSHPRNDECCL